METIKILVFILAGLMIVSIAPSIKITESETVEDGAIMWYGHESRLVCIQLSSDGQTAYFTESPLLQENGNPMPSNTFTSLTMLQDGSLILGTITGNSWPFVSKLYHIKSPQCNGNTSYAKLLGTMPDQIGIEALYTDASNRIYAMDTGEQVSSREGNRLLRFTGDVLNGDFQFEVITDLSLSVPDIDGLGPGINKTNGWVVDTPGFAMDTYNVYNVDYVTGTFSYVGSSDGVYAIHAINGSWFSDGKSRLYVISGIPQAGEKLSTLYEINPDTGKTLLTLGSGPSGTGLTGPLPPGPSDFPDFKESPVADAGPDQTVNEGDTVQFIGCNSSGSLNGVPPFVDPSVLALWHMDEDSGSTIYDVTSNNNDGIISGASWTTGKFGSALRFGDTDLVYEIPAYFDDYITTNITVMAWVYWEGPHPGTYSPNSYIFDARDFEGTRGGFILYLDPSGTLIFILLYGNTAGDYQIVQSTCKVPIKRWTHIAGVLDYTNGELKLYINGNEDTSIPATKPYHDFGGSHWDVAIGNNRYAPGDNKWAPFNGIIDEVVIYNEALTTHELPSTPAEIISYKWDLDCSDGIDWDNPDATGPTPTHIYGDDGVYIVTLKITDETNATDTDTCNITVINVRPTVAALPEVTINEFEIVTLTGHAIDPGSDDLTFTWNWGYAPWGDKTTIYYNDGLGPDPFPSPTINPRNVTEDKTCQYGDDGVFAVTLIVSDDDGGLTTVRTNVTVNNVNPTVTIESVTMDVEIGLRVAGSKWSNVAMTLYEDDQVIGYIEVERWPGKPNDNPTYENPALPTTFDMTKSYRAIVTYDPYPDKGDKIKGDQPNNGKDKKDNAGNPVWIVLRFEDGSEERIPHTFNTQQSKKRDSDHWNHVEPWEVDLMSCLIGHPFEITAHVTDPGSDDETLTYHYVSQSAKVTYLNNPPNPDSHPSPEVNPRDVTDSTILTYEGPATLVLTVEDDDSGTVSVSLGIA